MEKGIIRVAVVGQGLIGGRRARALLSLPGAALAATVDPAGRDTSLRASPGTPHTADLSDLDLDLIDAAIVAVPHHIAADVASTLLRAGKPVLIEKPLGINGTQARALELLAADVDRPSFAGYNYRFMPGARRLLELARSDALGVLRSIDMLIGHGGHPNSAEGWKLDPERAGGGVLLDPGVHLLDLLLRFDATLAWSVPVASGGFWGTGIEEDVALTFRSGALIGSLRVSHVRWVNTFRIEVFGEEGYAIAEGRGGTYGPMTLRTGRRWAWIDDPAGQRAAERVEEFGTYDTSLEDELAAVIAHWRREPTTDHLAAPATFAEARAVTELWERLALSLAQSL